MSSEVWDSTEINQGLKFYEEASTELRAMWLGSQPNHII